MKWGAVNYTGHYMCRSSKVIAKVAIPMDINWPDHPLYDEESFFHEAHKKCKVYKTLALQFFHPAVRRILHLAAMDIKSECTREISKF